MEERCLHHLHTSVAENDLINADHHVPRKGQCTKCKHQETVSVRNICCGGKCRYIEWNIPIWNENPSVFTINFCVNYKLRKKPSICIYQSHFTHGNLTVEIWKLIDCTLPCNSSVWHDVPTLLISLYFSSHLWSTQHTNIVAMLLLNVVTMLIYRHFTMLPQHWKATLIDWIGV